MARVVSFYEKLPRGAAPEIKAKGLLGRYQAKYFGKDPSATREPPLPLHTATNCANIYLHSYYPLPRLHRQHRLRSKLLLPSSYVETLIQQDPLLIILAGHAKNNAH